MVCPGCGGEVERDSRACSCGVRWVGKPQFQSAQGITKLFRPLCAWALLSAGFLLQFVVIIRNLYLTTYRWPVQLGLTLVDLSKLLLPLTVIASFLAWQGWRAARQEPCIYGGRKLALGAGLLSSAIFVVYASAVIARIPQMIENGRVRRFAQTQANLYRLSGMVEAYRNQYGTYPRRLIDLQELDPNSRPVLDYWDHEFIYDPISTQVASRGSAAPFQGYKLISRGADGVLGTEDDISLQNDQLSPPMVDGPRKGHVRRARPTP